MRCVPLEANIDLTINEQETEVEKDKHREAIHLIEATATTRKKTLLLLFQLQIDSGGSHSNVLKVVVTQRTCHTQQIRCGQIWRQQ